MNTCKKSAHEHTHTCNTYKLIAVDKEFVYFIFRVIIELPSVVVV